MPQDKMSNRVVYIMGKTISFTENQVYRAVRAIGDVQCLEKVWRRQDDSATCCYVCTFLDEFAAEYALKSGELPEALGRHVVVSQNPPGSMELASTPASSLHRFEARQVTCRECAQLVLVRDLETHFGICKLTTQEKRRPKPSTSSHSREPVVELEPRKGPRRDRGRDEAAPRIKIIQEDRPRRPLGTSARIESRDEFWDDSEGVFVNHYNSKSNPAGGYKYHPTLAEEEARRRGLEKLERSDHLPDGQRRCMCCDRIYTKGVFSGICERCKLHVHCAHCDKRFWPSESSLGRICSECWASIKDSPGGPPRGRRVDSDAAFLTSYAKEAARRRCSLRKGRTPSR